MRYHYLASSAGVKLAAAFLAYTSGYFFESVRFEKLIADPYKQIFRK